MSTNSGGKPSKYRARRVTVGGETFDSQKEANRWQYLKLLERAGEIRDLQRQVVFYIWAGRKPAVMGENTAGYGLGQMVRLPKKFQYRLDFQYYDMVAHGWVYEDVKGFKTPMYKLKKALIEASYGIKITEV